jgi:hypothetical protein
MYTVPKGRRIRGLLVELSKGACSWREGATNFLRLMMNFVGEYLRIVINFMSIS